MTVEIMENHSVLSPPPTIKSHVKITPPRVKISTTDKSGNNNNNNNKSSSSDHLISKGSNTMSDIIMDNNSEDEDEEELKKTSSTTDDLLTTEEDTDMEEEEEEQQDKLFLGLTHENNDVSNIFSSESTSSNTNEKNNNEYNAYTTSHLDKLYHPTSSIFDENNNKKEMDNNQRGGFFNNNGTDNFLTPHHDSPFLQETSKIYERATFNRRPSQLQHEMSANINALGPPSHVLKARRLSKTIIKPSSSTPITPVKSLSTNSLSMKDKRKPSIVNNYTKEFSDSNNSAVSPRFMALRKLSEVTTLPSHSISYSAVPPVPQIPATYHNAADNHPNTSTQSEATISKTSTDENRILARIDDIIETQLQFHLGQVIWRASESHLEARKFWEEQKKEMFGFAATLVDRMEIQEDITRRMTLSSLKSGKSVGEEPTLETLKEEVAMYKAKAKKQMFEIESLKTRNFDLEKQHEIDVISMSKQWENKETTLKKLKELDLKHVQIVELEEKNKELNIQIKQMQTMNYKLQEELLAIKSNSKSKDKSTTKQKKSSSTSKEEEEVKVEIEKPNANDEKTENWADIMQSEDEAKKSADEWANKYRELQTSYFEVCLEVERSKKDGMSLEDEKKIFELSQSIIAKDEEIRHLKQAENVSRIQMDYMQLELNKYQRSISPLAEIDDNMNKQKANKAAKRKSQHRKSTPAMSNTQKVSPPQKVKEIINRPVTPSQKVNEIASRPVTPHKKPIEIKQQEQQKPSPPPVEKEIPSSSPSANPSNSHSSEYITENGYLTFTTEINGVLSNYSIKLPTTNITAGYQKPKMNNNNRKSQAPPAIQEQTTTATAKKNKLNPNAVTWKS